MSWTERDSWAVL